MAIPVKGRPRSRIGYHVDDSWDDTPRSYESCRHMFFFPGESRRKDAPCKCPPIAGQSSIFRHPCPLLDRYTYNVGPPDYMLVYNPI